MEFKILKKDSGRNDIGKVADIYLAVDFELNRKSNVDVFKRAIATIKDDEKRKHIEKLWAE